MHCEGGGRLTDCKWLGNGYITSALRKAMPVELSIWNPNLDSTLYNHQKRQLTIRIILLLLLGCSRIASWLSFLAFWLTGRIGRCRFNFGSLFLARHFEESLLLQMNSQWVWFASDFFSFCGLKNFLALTVVELLAKNYASRLASLNWIPSPDRAMQGRSDDRWRFESLERVCKFLKLNLQKSRKVVRLKKNLNSFKNVCWTGQAYWQSRKSCCFLNDGDDENKNNLKSFFFSLCSFRFIFITRQPLVRWLRTELF